ncbi:MULTISPECIES: sugar ABC transporter substrate-binding protein [unclassified Sinorhizobium]|uniref:ABC transporter substrate-binding protein n=1 Tax=unclassified Sinorhizobium TaxID=2613772 RepID=UPI0024C46BD1|nr:MULTISPECIES: sugar ABC transporter substrate-binding protein [unclassified Sinorhizobium]MDK1373645.1 sugar ABC transporter substrate-binding protein [Sinorhizobium sp. 6-70]MDK1477793.1 sugar ABC transporter substrate-binding protein [Sinorhizobium sp. 6-117]
MEKNKGKYGGPAINRRSMMIGSAATIAGAGLMRSALFTPALAQSKPQKLTVLGDSAPWKGTIVEDAIPAFTKETGIEVEYIQLPNEPLITRARAELTSGSTTSFDVMQMGASMIGWMHPYMEDVNELLKKAGGKYAADFGMDEFSQASLDLASIDGVLRGVPYRSTTYILHYQPALLEAVGIKTPPTTFAEYLDAAQKLTEAGKPNRFGVGYCARQGGAIVDHFGPYLLSAGGGFYDSKTKDIWINNAKSLAGLEFYASLLNKHNVVPQDALTWEWDEIIANGQNDRYAMAITLNASATPINRSEKSKTKGKWKWAMVPGLESAADSRSSLGGWSFAVPSKGAHTGWAFEFVQFITSREWAKRSMEKGNASARLSVLTDPEVVNTYGFTSVMADQLKTAIANPRDAFWGAVEAQLRAGLSKALLGEASPKDAMDEVATGWERTMRRAG